MEKPTPEQAAWVMEKIFESLDGGYSFRGMIYNALGYDDPESYSLFFNAGGMSLTNMHTWYEEFRELSLALEIATKAHKGQVDKAGHPYIAHPVIVASMVDETDEKVVALLHDVIEDTALTIDDLRKAGFSGNTLDAVQAITKVEGDSYDEYLVRVAANPIAREVQGKH